MESRIKYFLAAVGAAVIWGFFSITLRSLKAYPAEQILYYRIFTSLLITWLLIGVFKRNVLLIDFTRFKTESRKGRSTIVWLTILAGVLITGNWWTFIYAVNNVSIRSAAFAYMICPLITALGGFFILKEELSRLKLVAIGIAVSSVILLGSGALYEVFWSVFIASLYAFYLIIQRLLRSADKLNMLGIHLIVATVLMLPLFIHQFDSIPSTWVFWGNILIVSVVFTIIPLFLSLYALSGIPSSTAGIIIYINPIIAFTVAFFYFHERVEPMQLAAYFLLFIAVLVFNWGIIGKLFALRRA